jgi:hypothetical protein
MEHCRSCGIVAESGKLYRISIRRPTLDTDLFTTGHQLKRFGTQFIAQKAITNSRLSGQN